MSIPVLIVLLVTVQDVPWLDQLAAASARWSAARPASYEYTIALSGFDWSVPLRCSVAPTGVRVEEVPQPRHDQREWTPAMERVFVRYCVIENLFAMTERHLKLRIADVVRGVDHRAPVVAKYDERLGFPTDVFIDPANMVADDELVLKVSGFVVIR